MNEITLVYVEDFLERSRKEVQDERVFKVAERKLSFLKMKGLRYPSLQAKKLQNLYHGENELWEFRITKKYRCYFTYSNKTNTITVIKIGNHL